MGSKGEQRVEILPHTKRQLAVRNLLANLLEHYIQRWLRHALRAARPPYFFPRTKADLLKLFCHLAFRASLLLWNSRYHHMRIK